MSDASAMNPPHMNPVVAEVTRRVAAESGESRAAYLDRIKVAGAQGPGRGRLSCANWAHAFAASPGVDKVRALDPNAPNLGIVSAYNDISPTAHREAETAKAHRG